MGTTTNRAAQGDLHAVHDQVFLTKDFPLQSGRILPELRVAYETYGSLATDLGNAVLLTHGYTSSHRMAGRARPTLAEGLWSSLIGPGKAIDTDRLFVVSSNMIGSSYGSTGPADLDPATGRGYGPDFPDISLVDIVTAQRALLRHLGVAHLVAVIGPSYGGFQAFQWAVTFPGLMDGIVAVTTALKGGGDGPSDDPSSLEWLTAQLEADPGWHGGRYDRGGVGDTLARIRQETLVKYGIHEHLAAAFPDPTARQAEIERVSRQWASEFGANSLLVLGRAAARYDVEQPGARPVRPVPVGHGLPAVSRAGCHGQPTRGGGARGVCGDRQRPRACGSWPRRRQVGSTAGGVHDPAHAQGLKPIGSPRIENRPRPAVSPTQAGRGSSGTLA